MPDHDTQRANMVYLPVVMEDKCTGLCMALGEKKVSWESEKVAFVFAVVIDDTTCRL